MAIRRVRGKRNIHEQDLNNVCFNLIPYVSAYDGYEWTFFDFWCTVNYLLTGFFKCLWLYCWTDIFNIDNLFVVVGPCIGKENYEIKIDFYEKFVNQNPRYEDFFKKISDNKYIFDLRGFINNKIADLNIKNIENIEMDTFKDRETFYSHRRSVRNKEEDYGRCISVILMS